MISDKFLKPYNPQETEERIYKLWEESGFFNPDTLPGKREKTFTIVMPPPNVTGVLHMGHALMLTLEDIMIRYKRMCGFKTLWLPGTDHAAIATQARVEKDIYKTEKKSRHDLGREEFLKRVEAFAKQSHDTITSQIRVMGASCDWSREAYTLDEKRSLAVQTMFKMMYDDGLIYRGSRIVNWDPKGQTTISDDEIVYEERKAKLHTFRYSKDFPIPIATTRPETKLGDVGVAVHPDGKWKQYIGQTFEIPDFAGVSLSIKVVGDTEVDPEFGTGAIGITPTHSFIDWEIAGRHALNKDRIVINEYAKMTEKAGPHAGKKTSEARESIVEWLKSEGLLEKEEEITQNVSTAERTGGIVEPLPKLQWFIDVNKPIKAREGKTLKDLMREAVKSGDIKILPDHFEKIYFHWIEDLRDWCISRQIWFGHRVPVWYRNNPKGEKVKVEEGTEEIHVGEPPRGDGWEQDPDTLDTWFSSGLWTFSTLGWPINKEIGFNEKLVSLIQNGSKTKTYRLRDHQIEKDDVIRVHNSQTKKDFGYLNIIQKIETTIGELDFNQDGHEKYTDKEGFLKFMHSYYPEQEITDATCVWQYTFKYTEKSDIELYHPTDVLETGYEILFFWIARMVLMTKYALGTVPFRTVYLHGTVRDGQGRKMSKSLGNGIDPIDVAKKFGTDAGRMALIVGNTPGTDMNISEDKIRGYKNFANKLWNIVRFVIENTQGELFEDGFTGYTETDAKLREERHEMFIDVTKDMEEYRFYMAAEKLYHYAWHTFADKILEESKVIFEKGTDEEKKSRKQLLLHTLDKILKSLHPFIPFVTEEIWQLWKQPSAKDGMLMIQAWPVQNS